MNDLASYLSGLSPEDASYSTRSSGNCQVAEWKFMYSGEIYTVKVTYRPESFVHLEKVVSFLSMEVFENYSDQAEMGEKWTYQFNGDLNLVRFKSSLDQRWEEVDEEFLGSPMYLDIGHFFVQAFWQLKATEWGEEGLGDTEWNELADGLLLSESEPLLDPRLL